MSLGSPAPTGGSASQPWSPTVPLVQDGKTPIDRFASGTVLETPAVVPPQESEINYLASFGSMVKPNRRDAHPEFQQPSSPGLGGNHRGMGGMRRESAASQHHHQQPLRAGADYFSAGGATPSENGGGFGGSNAGNAGRNVPVHQFVNDLQATLQSAAQDCHRLGVEGTVIRVMCDDISARLQSVQLPREDATLMETGEMPDDVLALQHKCEDLHEDTVGLKKQLTMEQEKTSELAHKLDLRNEVVDKLRKQSHSIGLAGKQHTASIALDFMDAVEKEAALSARKAEDDLVKQADAYEQSKIRHKHHFQKIINAKETEIVQIQLRFRNTLKSIQGSHAMSLDSLSQENEHLKKQVADATQVATQKAEAMMQIKLEESEHRIRQECAATIRSKQNELDRALAQVSDMQMHLALVEEETNMYAEQAARSQRELRHVIEVEHKMQQELHQAQINQLETQLKKVAGDASAEVSALREKLEQLEARRKKEVGELTEETHALNEKVNHLKQDIAAKDAAIKEHIAAKGLLNADVLRLRELVTDLESELEGLRRTSTEALIEEWSARLQTQKEDFEDKIAMLQVEVTDAKREAEGEASKAQLYKRQLSLAEMKISDLQKEVEGLKREKVLLTEDLRQEKVAHGETTTKNKQLQTEIEKLLKQIEKLKEELQQQQQLGKSALGASTGQPLGNSTELPGAIRGRRRSLSMTPRSTSTPSGGGPKAMNVRSISRASNQSASTPTERNSPFTGQDTPVEGGDRSLSTNVVEFQFPVEKISVAKKEGEAQTDAGRWIPNILESVGFLEKSTQVDVEELAAGGGTSLKRRSTVGYTPSVAVAGGPGNVSATAETRSNNAKLRCELVEVRLSLCPETQQQLTTSATTEKTRNESPGLTSETAGSNLAHGGAENRLLNPTGLPEYDPIPITSQLDVIRQNQRMSAELARRRTLLDLERATSSPTQHQNSTHGLSIASIVSRVETAEINNSPRKALELPPKLREEKKNEDDHHDADQFVPTGELTSVTPNTGGGVGEGDTARSHSAVPLSAPPQDYNGYIVRMPYSMMPSSTLHLDSRGHNQHPEGCVTMGSGFRRRPQSARTVRRQEEIAASQRQGGGPSPRGTTTRVIITDPKNNQSPRRQSTEHTPLKEIIDPSQYFNVRQFTSQYHKAQDRPQSAKSSVSVRGATQIIVPKPGGTEPPVPLREQTRKREGDDEDEDDFHIPEDRSVSASPEEDQQRPPQVNLVVSSYTRRRHSAQGKSSTTTTTGGSAPTTRGAAQRAKTQSAVQIQKSFSAVMQERRLEGHQQ